MSMRKEATRCNCKVNDELDLGVVRKAPNGAEQDEEANTENSSK